MDRIHDFLHLAAIILVSLLLFVKVNPMPGLTLTGRTLIPGESA
jgi:hypothetical protein